MRIEYEGYTFRFRNLLWRDIRKLSRLQANEDTDAMLDHITGLILDCRYNGESVADYDELEASVMLGMLARFGNEVEAFASAAAVK